VVAARQRTEVPAVADGEDEDQDRSTISMVHDATEQAMVCAHARNKDNSLAYGLY
jgi:hypothetical protein